MTMAARRARAPDWRSQPALTDEPTRLAYD